MIMYGAFFTRLQVQTFFIKNGIIYVPGFCTYGIPRSFGVLRRTLILHCIAEHLTAETERRKEN